MVTVLVSMVILLLLVIFWEIWKVIFMYTLAVLIFAALSIVFLTVIGVEPFWLQS